MLLSCITNNFRGFVKNYKNHGYLPVLCHLDVDISKALSCSSLEFSFDLLVFKISFMKNEVTDDAVVQFFSDLVVLVLHSSSVSIFQILQNVPDNLTVLYYLSQLFNHVLIAGWIVREGPVLIIAFLEETITDLRKQLSATNSVVELTFII